MKRLFIAAVLFLATSMALGQSAHVKTAKPNLSPEFSKAALKALLAARDFEDPTPAVQASEDAEVEAKTTSEQEAFRGLQAYDSWRMLYMKGDGSLAGASIAEAMSPGQCFLGLKAQYVSRTWSGTPKECSK